jgi:hypothetical protein
LAEVLLGEYPLPYYHENPKLMTPPQNPAKKNERFDSVKGNYKGSDLYMVY